MRTHPILLLAVGLTLAACGDPGAPLEVSTGARITATTTGLDIDPDGYRVEVDGTNGGPIPANGTVLTPLDPGSRTIALTGLTLNCAVDGPGSRPVTVVDNEVARIDFAVVCTATSGVIGVVVEASGIDADGEYKALVDGTPFPIALSGTAYLSPVPAGDHVISLVPPANCSVETEPQPVRVTAGGLIRDTVSVTFSVTCRRRAGTLRITAPTSGSIPTAPYSIWICRVQYGCIFDDIWTLLGELEPNGTLVANREPGRYRLNLRDIPARCRVRPSVLSPEFIVTDNATLDIEFRVRCSP
jgi:hypothetical protein